MPAAGFALLYPPLAFLVVLFRKGCFRSFGELDIICLDTGRFDHLGGFSRVPRLRVALLFGPPTFLGFERNG